jgi:hypothetical protein
MDGSYGSSSAVPQSPASTQQLRAPPPLIRAPVQVSMPVMYAPMYYSQNSESQKNAFSSDVHERQYIEMWWL